MGKFGDFLKNAGNAIGNGALNGLTGGIGGLISGGLDQLFGGGGPSIWDQVDAQKMMADYQFALNEKAADAAFERNMKMYQRNYEDQSYKAMRKQMEDAGLSIGLMYGGSGSGGGGGAVTGSPQGGITGGLALPSAAAFKQAENQQKQTDLNIALGAKEIELKDAQIKNLLSGANENEAHANYMNTLVEPTAAKLNQEGRKLWFENEWWKFTHEAAGKDVEVLGSKNWGTLVLSEGSMEWQQMWRVLLNSQAEYGLVGAQTNLAQAIAALNNQKANGYLLELSCEISKVLIEDKKAMAMLEEARAKNDYNKIMAVFAQNDQIRAQCQAFATMWQTGEYTNWKNILGAILQTVQVGINLGTAITTRGLIGGQVAGNPTPAAPKPTIYGAPNMPTQTGNVIWTDPYGGRIGGAGSKW